YAEAMHRARSLPGGESASVMPTTPLTNSGWDNFVAIPGRTDLSEEQRSADITAVGPQMLETMRVPLLAGRDFTDGDSAQSVKVAIISENAARRWFPQGALGEQIGMQNGATLRVVGIAGNTKYQN